MLFGYDVTTAFWLALIFIGITFLANVYKESKKYEKSPEKTTGPTIIKVDWLTVIALSLAMLTALIGFFSGNNPYLIIGIFTLLLIVKGPKLLSIFFKEKK
jgi:hypothetical protein